MLAVVLMVVVAVVVTVFTAGAAAVAMSAAAQGITFGAAATAAGGVMAAGTAVLTGGAIAAGAGMAVALGGSITAATMAAAAVGGFMGSVASQVVGKALGVVDHFSLRSAFAAGLTAGFSAGIGASGIVGKLAGSGEYAHVARGAIGSAIGSVSSYAANRIAGVDVSFSWKSIAASAVTGAISAAIEPGLNDMFGFDLGKESGQFGADLVNGFAGRVINTHVRRAFGFDDPIDYANMAADAFGNTLGNALTGRHAKLAADVRAERTAAEQRQQAVERAAAQQAQLQEANERIKQLPTFNEIRDDLVKRGIENPTTTDVVRELERRGMLPANVPESQRTPNTGSTGDAASGSGKSEGYRWPTIQQAMENPAAAAAINPNVLRESIEFAAWANEKYGVDLPILSAGSSILDIAIVNQTVLEPFAHGRTPAPVTEADYRGTMQEAFGLTEQAKDRYIQEGIDNGWSPERIALGLTMRHVGYEAGNLLTLGFWREHDGLVVARNRGEISEGQYWRATAVGAVTRIGVLATGGAAAPVLVARYGVVAAGAIIGGGTDAVVQLSDMYTYRETGGIVGQESFNWRQTALSAGAGALLGKIATSDVANLRVSDLGRLRLQNPIVLETSPSVVRSFPGGIVKELRSPVYVAAEGAGAASTTTRAALVAEANASSAALRAKYGGMTSAQRMARIDELSRANWTRRVDEMVNSQQYVFRYLTQSGLETSLKYNSVRGYATTNFSSSSDEIMKGAQIFEQWPGSAYTGPVKYGVAIPVSELRGFQVARPMGGKATAGWEVYANSYPAAGRGGYSQFLTDSVPLDKVHLFTLRP